MTKDHANGITRVFARRFSIDYECDGAKTLRGRSICQATVSLFVAVSIPDQKVKYPVGVVVYLLNSHRPHAVGPSTQVARPCVQGLCIYLAPCGRFLNF